MTAAAVTSEIPKFDDELPQPLNETDLRAALFTVAHYLRTVPSAPTSLWQLRYKLDHAIRIMMSGNGHRCGCDRQESEHDMELVGAQIAAGLIGCTTRHVGRIAADIGGRKLGRQWWFDAAKVREYAQALRQKELDQ